MFGVLVSQIFFSFLVLKPFLFDVQWKPIWYFKIKTNDGVVGVKQWM